MKSYLLFFFLFLISTPGWSQSRLKIAEQKYQEGDYAAAISQINLLLENRKDYSDKDLANAYFIRGKAYFQYTTDPIILKKQPNAFFQSYADFKMVAQLDHKNTLSDLVEQKLKQLKPAIAKNTLRIIQLLYQQELTLAQKLEEASLAEGFIEILIDLEPKNYIYYDLRAQAKLAKQDSLPAMMDFQNSIKLYQDKPPVIPDFLIAYAFYRTALIQRYALKYEEQALSSLQAGLRLLEKEYKRIPQPDQVQYSQYQQAFSDLQNFELDLYYQNSKQKDKALQKFEVALQKDPNSYAKRCAYASILEKTNPEKAIVQYLKAIEIDPKKKQAYFNIGVLYINQSINYLKQASGQEDIINKEISANQIAKKALPYLEEAFRIDPKDQALLDSIVSISLKVNDLIKYQHYKNIRSQTN